MFNGYGIMNIYPGTIGTATFMSAGSGLSFPIASGSVLVHRDPAYYPTVKTQFPGIEVKPESDRFLLLFLLELMSSREERDLIRHLQDQPTSETTKTNYVEYLEHHGRSFGASLIKKGWLPGCNINSESKG